MKESEEMDSNANPVGIYISIPFCRAKCSFCNFASGVGSDAAIETYLERLSIEIATAREQATKNGLLLPAKADSIYFGGGTPSLLRSDQLRVIIGKLHDKFEIEDKAEVTVEAAPGQISDEVLRSLANVGVNRVSLGVQSFVDREAQAVGRFHTGASCLAEIARLRASGIENVGLDLICGLPHQTEASFGESLRAASGSGATHVSVYMLEIDEKSRLGAEVLNGGARLHAPAVPGELAVVAMYEAACRDLPMAGFEQYEISNFYAKDMRSRHNLKYWMRSSYLGFGLDAHSMLLSANGGPECVRWANTADLARYSAGRDQPDLEEIDLRMAFEEEIFLGLRLTDGLSDDRLKPYPVGWRQALHRLAEPMIHAGYVKFSGNGYRLTREGRVISNSIFAELLGEDFPQRIGNKEV